MKKEQNQLIKGIFYVLSANILSMLSGICTGFFLPKFLSVDSYAMIKTYQLYITYCALLHLGFNDGMLLKYGGKSIHDINSNELYTDLSTLRIFQAVAVGLGCLFALIVHDPILLWAALSTFPLNIVAYFKNLYQAVGEFKRFSFVLNSSTGLMLFVNLVLLFCFKTDNWHFYIAGYFAVDAFIWIAMEVINSKVWSERAKRVVFSAKCLKGNIKSGLFLLLGNSASSLMTGMDRLFVKFLLQTSDFAMYSFAASMENFLNLAMGSVAVTLYNYFATNSEKERVESARSYVTLLSALLIAAAFPLIFIVDHFLDKYNASKSIIIILFAAEFYYTIVLCIYVNLYKVHKRQRTYFLKLVADLIIGFFLNELFYVLIGKNETFAIATFLSSYIWMLISEKDFPQYQIRASEKIYNLLIPVLFMICGTFLGSILGFVVYVTVFIILSLILMHDTFLSSFKHTKEFLHRG